MSEIKAILIFLSILFICVTVSLVSVFAIKMDSEKTKTEIILQSFSLVEQPIEKQR